MAKSYLTRRAFFRRAVSLPFIGVVAELKQKEETQAPEGDVSTYRQGDSTWSPLNSSAELYWGPVQITVSNKVSADEIVKEIIAKTGSILA